MAIIVPPTSVPADVESFILDGVDLNDGTLNLISVDASPPRQRQEWIGAADSEAQLLVRDPLYENRKVTAVLDITQTGVMDDALDLIGVVRDKLAKASKSSTGVPLTWNPTGSGRTVTFDVLAGEVTAMPISNGDDGAWTFRAPRVTIEMTCKPYWRGTEVTTSSASSSTPFVTLAIPSVPGDAPALGRLIVTDAATQARRHVEWGLEGPLTYNSGTSLLVDSDSLVTAGFGGTGGTAAGAYDPNATGNTTVTASLIAGQATAVCGTGNLAHLGAFRVKARVQGTAGTTFRLAWRAGDSSQSANAWASVTGDARWTELDLGTILIPAVTAGTQRWTGQIEALHPTAASTLHVDYLVLIPASDGYGKARASYTYTPGIVSGYDQLTGATLGAVLNGRVAPAGGTWATSGSTTDFTFGELSTGSGAISIRRATTIDTPRWAILGTTNYTDTQVEALNITGSSHTRQQEPGLVARWTDSSNYLRMNEVRTPSPSFTRKLQIVQRVAGAETVLAILDISSVSYPVFDYVAMRLLVFASGRVIATIFDKDKTAVKASIEGFSTALATGGALATGKPGIYDKSNETGADARFYDDFFVSTPAPEPIVMYGGRTLQVRHDDVIRDDPTGAYTGRPAAYRGSRFLAAPGTSRVLVKARRSDIEATYDDNVTDATQVQVAYTPRGLVVPR